MTAQELETIKTNYIRFVKSGFNYRWFTKVLYNAFYIHSNLFIAHYDRSGFYNSRFNTVKGLNETVYVLLNSGPRNDTHKLLRDITKDKIDFFEGLQQKLLADQINAYEKECQEVIDNSKRSFLGA